MKPTMAAAQLRGSLTQYLTTTYPLADEDTRAALERFLGHPETGIFRGPYLRIRFKGLEYQRMIIAGVADGLVPREAVNRLRDTDPVRYRHEIQRARSLLFVAATRARDSVDVSGTENPARSSMTHGQGPRPSVIENPM